MFYAIAKCQDFIHVHANFKEDMKRYLVEYQFDLKQIEEDGCIRDYNTMMNEVQLMITNYLEIEDINILKFKKQIKYGSDMVVWCSKMKKNSNTITVYLLENEGIMEILNTGIKNRETFMGTNFETIIASHV